MLCQNCKKNPATVHVTRIINNKKTELHLCQSCAEEREDFGLFSPFSITEIFSSIVDLTSSELTAKSTPDIKCQVCGRDYKLFKKTGLFGCENCYKVFAKETSPLIKRIQGGATAHTGKTPKSQSARLKVNKQLKELKEELKEAIKIEAFEEAAVLRDRIKNLEEPQEGGSHHELDR